jgi:hypothetical protein
MQTSLNNLLCCQAPEPALWIGSHVIWDRWNAGLPKEIHYAPEERVLERDH